MTDQMHQKWFAKLHAGDFSLDKALRVGRPVEVDRDKMETLTENNQHYATQDIPDILRISKSSIESHLHRLDYVNQFEVWVSHKLSKETLLDLISACNSLLKCNKNVLFLKINCNGQ